MRYLWSINLFYTLGFSAFFLYEKAVAFDYSDSEEDDTEESEEADMHTQDSALNFFGDVKVKSVESEEMETPEPGTGASLGESCTSSEQCERSVVDSECRENTCTCKRGFVKRSDLWCQYVGNSLNLPSEVYDYECEDPNCEVSPCISLYSRLREMSGSSEISSPHQMVSLPCEGNINLKFLSSSHHGFGQIITVNYLCAVYVSRNDSFTVTHIKVRKPDHTDNWHTDNECLFEGVPCPKLHRTCAANCSDYNGTTDYVFGVRNNCKPEVITLNNSTGTSLEYPLLCFVLLFTKMFR